MREIAKEVEVILPRTWGQKDTTIEQFFEL